MNKISRKKRESLNSTGIYYTSERFTLRRYGSNHTQIGYDYRFRDKLGVDKNISLTLFSGVQGNGNSDGRGGGAWRWGHEHAVPYYGVVMLQPSLIDRVAFVVGGLCGASCWSG